MAKMTIHYSLSHLSRIHFSYKGSTAKSLPRGPNNQGCSRNCLCVSQSSLVGPVKPDSNRHKAPPLSSPRPGRVPRPQPELEMLFLTFFASFCLTFRYLLVVKIILSCCLQVLNLVSHSHKIFCTFLLIY